jgi:hypothetical protein
MAKEMVGLRLPTELLQKIDMIAAYQTRSRANTIEMILTEWFREKHPEMMKDPTPEQLEMLKKWIRGEDTE